MSRFFSEKFKELVPYVPGEQPRDAEYVKLNTNESPFPPPKSVKEAIKSEAGKLQLYSDPEAKLLVKAGAEVWGVKETQLLFTNGSDEILNFAFAAFCDETHPIVFPEFTYGFYRVFAKLNGVPFETLPLKEDFSVDYKDYVGIGKNIVIANPNAPTGIALGRKQIEEIVSSNPDNVVIIDEAYVDFGGESCVPLIKKYDNLLVTQTFSKSRSLAGGRLGVGIGSECLISDLNTVKYSTNPYNVNRMTMAAGVAALKEEKYFQDNCAEICRVREYVKEELVKLGFTVLPSKTNFLFAKSDKVGGKKLYEGLKLRGVLVRHFDMEGIKAFNRITVGTQAQMDIFLAKVKEILKEKSR